MGQEIVDALVIPASAYASGLADAHEIVRGLPEILIHEGHRRDILAALSEAREAAEAEYARVMVGVGLED